MIGLTTIRDVSPRIILPQIGEFAGLSQKAFHLVIGPRTMGHFDGGLGVQVQMFPQVDGCPVPLSQ